MGKITKFLKLFIPGINDRGKIISECIDPGFEKIDQEFEKINLKQEQFQINIDGKEDKFIKNDAFNKEFGVEQNKVLEGHRMAQIQGVEKCGGDVQTPGVKKVGYSYWCTANKDFYVCKVENSLNYIDDAYFDAFSNVSLLGKLQILLDRHKTFINRYTSYNAALSVPPGWKKGIVTIQFLGTKGIQVNVPVFSDSFGLGEMFYMHPNEIGEMPSRNRIVYTNNSFKSESDLYVVVHAILEYF